MSSEKIFPKVSALIVNYNGYADTIECLHSLKEQVGVNCKPLVIDNASHNGSVDFIKSAHPDVEIIQTERNLGFTGGNNIGIKHALKQGCDYLFLVNNDTTMEPDCLHELVASAEAHPEASVVGPAIYYYGDKTKPWFTGSRIEVSTGQVEMLVEDVRAQHLQTPYCVPWTTGCAMLIPSDRMREIGGFDKRFFCYWEDTDWSFRAHGLGYRCFVSPAAILYHKVSATTNKTSFLLDYYMTRNQLLFVSKHSSGKQRLQYLFSQTKRILQRAKHMLVKSESLEDKKKARVLITAAGDFYLHRLGPCRHAWLRHASISRA